MSEGHQSDTARIEAACRFLESHLSEEVTLERVAGEVHYSAFHFHRLFRGLTGETVQGYIRRLRMERAVHRLTHSDADILSIAMDLGYGSHEAFTRAFSKHFGINPSEFRATKQEPNHPVTEFSPSAIDVRLGSREACTVACIRHVGSYNQVGNAWQSLMKWGWSKIAFGKAEAFGLCYDDPDVTDAERVRYDACIVVASGTKVKHGVELQEIPGNSFAVTEHRGPYVTIGETYAKLFAHIVTSPIEGEQKFLGDPPSLEVYLNDPRKTKPEDLRTEIWMPVHDEPI